MFHWILKSDAYMLLGYPMSNEMHFRTVNCIIYKGLAYFLLVVPFRG